MTKTIMAVVFLLLAYLYTYPGLNPLFTGDSQMVMSDNTDLAASPFQNAAAISVWKENPARLFYGSVYADVLDPEKGAAFWMSWSDRWLAVLTSYLVPLEQIPTVSVVLLLLINGLCMYLLARYLKWNNWVAYGLAIAWAFCAFTRARAKVHASMVGTYHLPLIFLGMYLVVRGKTWKSVAAAAACFLFAVTTIHYFIITSAFLSPFFIAFIFVQPEFKKNWKQIVARLGVAVLPAIAFLVWNLAAPIPSGVRMNQENAKPQTGAMPDGELHPFLTVYNSHPIDYLTSDISLTAEAPYDWNPARYFLNTMARENVGRGNFHERTNGVRWTILAIAFFFVGGLLFRKIPREKDVFPTVMVLSALALFSFWLSLSPDMPFEGMGPSAWLYSLVSQIRVPSRAGILVHFALLLIVGYFFASQYSSRIKKLLLMPAVFPLVMVVDYPPLIQNMPMAKVEKPYQQLVAADGTCGTGMLFPFFSIWTDVNYYHFLQRLTGLPCPVVNSISDPGAIQMMMNRYPPSPQFVAALTSNPGIQDSVERTANCVPLSWIAFHEAIPQPWIQSLCDRLKWQLTSERICVAPERKPFTQWPHRCL